MRRTRSAHRPARAPARGLVLIAELDRQAAEALQWEVRRLVERYGLDPASVRVKSVRRKEEASG